MTICRPFFDEVAVILEGDHSPPVTNHFFPEPNETPTNYTYTLYRTALATTSDSGRGVLCINSALSQELHVLSPSQSDEKRHQDH